MTSLPPNFVDCPLLQKALKEKDDRAIWNYFDFLKKTLERAERQRDSLLLSLTSLKSKETPLKSKETPVTIAAHPPKKSPTKAFAKDLAKAAPDINVEDLGL